MEVVWERPDRSALMIPKADMERLQVQVDTERAEHAERLAELEMLLCKQRAKCELLAAENERMRLCELQAALPCAECENLKQRLAKLEAENAAVQQCAECENLKQRLAKLEAENAALQQCAECENLKQRLAKLEAENAALQQCTECASLSLREAELMAEVQQLRRQLDARDSDAEQLAQARELLDRLEQRIRAISDTPLEPELVRMVSCLVQQSGKDLILPNCFAAPTTRFGKEASLVPRGCAVEAVGGGVIVSNEKRLNKVLNDLEQSIVLEFRKQQALSHEQISEELLDEIYCGF